jgi:2-dehydropantoate 2-reductase
MELSLKMVIKNVAIIGLGSIGVTVGKQIDQKNTNLYVIVDEERKKRYTQNGIYINNEKIDFYYIVPGDKIKLDLIIFCVKQNHLQDAIELSKSFITKDTIIMSLLNGIKSEYDLINAFGDSKILYSFIVSNSILRENLKFTIYTYGTIFFGCENNNPNNENVIAVKNFFNRNKIDNIVPRDIKKRLWWKLMINVSINQVSAILRAGFKSMQHSEEVKNLMFLLMEEVVVLAQKENIDLNKEDTLKWYEQFNKLSPTGKPSMLFDIENNLPTEVDIFSGEIISLGKKHNIKTPSNEFVYNIIKYKEKFKE